MNPLSFRYVLRSLRSRFEVLAWVLAIASVVLYAGRAHGQADTGRINGNVTDSTGARIPNAKMTATRVESSQSTTVTANKEGEYVFPNLQTGHYNVTVDAPGFASVTKEGYELDDQSSVTVDFSLKAGQVEQVIITGQVAETVNTETGEVSHVIDGNMVRDLALNGRNYLDLLGILPGSVQVDTGDAMANITSGSTTNVVLNGTRATANGLYIDGMLNKDIGGNDRQFNNVGVDFIEHVKVQTSSFSSLYGQAAGPAVNVVTRSGTNSIHGTLFEYVRNNAFDAVNYFSKNSAGQPVHQHLRFNDFGGDVGGAAIQNKLFYFAGAEWKLIARNTSPTTVTLPLQAQLAGNFKSASGSCGVSAATLPGLDLNPNDANYCNISPFMGEWGRAMAAQYQRVISLATSYTGNACTTTNCTNNGNTIFELPYPYRNHEYVARVDYVLNKHQNMYGRWVNDTHTTTDPVGDGQLPSTPYHEMGPADNLVLSHTYAFRNSFNEASFAAVWSSFNQTPVGDIWQKSTYGYSYQPLFSTPGYKLGTPLITIYGYTTMDDERFLNRSHTTYLQGQDIYTTVLGRQQIKVGAFFGRMRKDQNGKPYYNGSVNFQSTATNASSSTGNALADALLGRFNSYTEANFDPYGLFRIWQAAAFVDHVWRATAKLSINSGLRYEWMTPWVSQQNNLAAFYPEMYDPKQAVTVTQDGFVVPGSGNPYNGLRRAGNGVPASEDSRVPYATSAAVLSVPTIGKRGFYNSQHVFMPRFGFAYDLHGNGQTAFRGGAGLFYDIPQGNAAYNALNSAPFLQSYTVQNGSMENLGAYSSQFARNVIGAQYAVDPHEVRPYVYQYNFGIQQQIDAGMFLQINYVGNQSRHMLRVPDINGVDPQTEDAVFQVNQSAAIDSMRPYKGYDAIYQYRTDVDGNYNSLQANINRRVGKGRFTFAYTWSKALSTASADTEVQHVYIYNKNYAYAPTSFDRRNAFAASYNVSTPTFARYNQIIRQSVGGWMLTGTWRWQGGSYMTPYGTDTFGVQNRANYAGLPVVYPHTQLRWWDTINPGTVVNFSAPTVGETGNTPKGIIVGPNFTTTAISARKTFSLTERYHLTVNLDGFNILNHPNFANPSVNVQSATAYTSSLGAATSATTDSASIGIASASAPRNLQAGARLTF